MSLRFPFLLVPAAAAVCLTAAAASPDIAPGTLRSPKGLCPLKHTDVRAAISGPLARVTVTQEFENPFAEKIEAVYTFPLPPDAAVDDMTMRVGERTIRGIIKTREEARKIYDEARRTGHVAGLLDQERPNIFTQSVANITPGAQVKITISYVETVPYEAGSYEFDFPMVVAPRYMPGRPTGKQGGGWAPDTTGVPDGSRISPPVTPEGTRAGHDISLEVKLDSGVAIESLASKTHAVAIERQAANRAVVRLRDQATIPNRDFILRYAVAGRRLEDAVLTHKSGKDGYFTLLLQPPQRVAPAEVTAKELVFVLDTSGSMSGFPIEKAKETMRLALDGLNPHDTFNLITFSGDTHVLFPQPVPATPENLVRAQEFLRSRGGSGGTEMMRAIRAALEPSDHQDHVRVVCFMTDGEVGNDFEILSEIQRHPNARVFAFGIGSSVNRFLLDNMARQGRGDVEYVGLKDDGSAAARRFHERVRSPLLTDIAIDWGGLAVTDVYPTRIPDVFAAKPVVLSGRYTSPGSGTVRLRGKMAGRDFTREIRVTLPAAQQENDVLGTLWARRKIADLMSRDFAGLQYGAPGAEVKDEITRLGLEFRLMTQFTSFVAVEEKTVTEGGQPRRVEVPVEMPEGMSYEGVFGREADRVAMNRPMAASRQFAMAGRVAGGVIGGVFATAGNPAAAPRRVTEETAAAGNRRSHVDFRIAALIQRVKDGRRPAVDESRFVFGGEAYLRITLADASAANLAQLRKAGLTVAGQQGNTVTGHIALDKLETLAKSAFLSWVAPWMRR